MIFRFHVISMSIFQDVLFYLINLYGKFAGTYTIHWSYVFFGKRLVVRISTPLQTNVPPRNVHFGPWLFAIPKTQCITYITWYIDQHVDGLGDIGKYIIIIDGLSGYKKIILPTIYNIFRGIDFINHEISGCENLNQPGFYGSCHHVMSGLPLPLLGSFPQGSG